MAVSTKRLENVRETGRIGYLYGHPRDLGTYETMAEWHAYRTGWDEAEKKKPGVQLQPRYTAHPNQQDKGS